MTWLRRKDTTAAVVDIQSWCQLLSMMILHSVQSTALRLIVDVRWIANPEERKEWKQQGNTGANQTFLLVLLLESRLSPLSTSCCMKDSREETKAPTILFVSVTVKMMGEKFGSCQICRTAAIEISLCNDTIHLYPSFLQPLSYS